MRIHASAEPERELFGVPVVLTGVESTSLMRDLMELWRLTYGTAPGDLDDDLDQCRRFFDPLIRGYTLRDRLASLPATPARLTKIKFGEPLIIDTGGRTLIVGVEARLMLSLLERQDLSEDHLVVSQSDVSEIERKALRVYQKWTRGRLDQVIALRSGKGQEVLQAISVGLIIALLVNRSDSIERAVVRWDHNTAEGKQIDVAIYAGAERFAAVVSGSRSGRSTGEQRLKGGYALSEARRRLAHRLKVVADHDLNGELLYIPSQYGDEVSLFIARDLARRPSLTSEKLAVAFDQLVSAFRAGSGRLAHQSMVFERTGDTRALKQRLLEEFSQAKLEMSQASNGET